MKLCTFQHIVPKPRYGEYFDLIGTPCGLAMEMVETKGDPKLLCPVHDRYPGYTITA